MQFSMDYITNLIGCTNVYWYTLKAIVYKFIIA